MRFIKSLKIAFVLCFVFCYSYSQKRPYLFVPVGAGVSDLTGYSLLSEICLEHRHFEFSLRWNYNSQIGYKMTRSTYYFERERIHYNDSFRELSGLFGMTFRVKRWFMTSVSGGIGSYKYIDKEIGNRYNFEVITKSYEGVGLALESQLYFFPGYNSSVGLGLTGFANINKDRSVFGVALTMALVCLQPKE